MKYKATLGVNAILITVFISLFLGSLVAFFTYLAIVSTEMVASVTLSAVILFVASLYCVAYLYHPRFYALDDDNIIISRPVNDVRISLQDVNNPFTVDKASMEWPERVGGNGGLFGFYGEFRNHFGLMTWYATKNSNFVMLEMKDNSRIVITPDNTGIVKEIRKLVGKHPDTRLT